MINAYLIHFTKLKDRLPSAKKALETIGLSTEVVTCWDGDALMMDALINNVNLQLWLEQTTKIAPILLQNAGYNASIFGGIFYGGLSVVEILKVIPNWMHPRPLGRGELSVILKHYYSLSRIAQGQDSHGLIAEDDIVLKTDSKKLFTKSLAELIECDGDYLDLAGGCKLRPSDLQGTRNITLVSPASTRTNACYIVSRRLAKLFVESYFPFVHPIDWHLLYLLSLHDVHKCYWCNEEVFIHGSESGKFTSWRSA